MGHQLVVQQEQVVGTRVHLLSHAPPALSEPPAECEAADADVLADQSDYSTVIAGPTEHDAL